MGLYCITENSLRSRNNVNSNSLLLVITGIIKINTYDNMIIIALLYNQNKSNANSKGETFCANIQNILPVSY